MGHEAVDGATGLWALQPLVQGATERIHHLNLQKDKGVGGEERSEQWLVEVMEGRAEVGELGDG